MDIAFSSPRGRLVRLAVALLTGIALSGLAACSSSAAADSPPPAPASVQPSGGALTETDANAWLDGVVPTALASSGIPGAAVSIVRDGRILTARGYGVADTGTAAGPRRDVDPARTLFRVGSVSKTVTATAVLRLVQEGRLDLDADVRRYLDFPLSTPKGVVTLRTLLTHTAGFEERVRGLISVTGSGPSLRATVADEQPEQVFAPGTTPAYSNWSYTLAGYIVQRVSGMPFADYVRSRVLEPAGMTSSTFAQPVPEALAPRLANGYPDDTQPALPQEFVAPSPAGALSSTATDMARFMLVQLGAEPGGQRILSQDTLRLMQAPALTSRTLGGLAKGRRMTLGFFDERTNGRPGLGHDGDTQVFHSAMRFYPKDGVGIFIALNGNGRGAADSLALRTSLMEGFADRYLPSRSGVRTGDDQIDRSLTAAAKRADGRAATGVYLTTRTPLSTFGSLFQLQGQTQVVARTDGTIVVSPSPGGVAPARFEELRRGLWREMGGETLITTRSVDGQVTDIGWGSAFTLTRTDASRDAGVVLPLLVGSLTVLLIAVLAWPAGALLRRRYGVGGPTGRSRTRILTRIGMLSALAAMAGWTFTAVSALGYQDVPDAPLRVFQALQGIGILALVPATAQVADAVRLREGVAVVAGRALVVVALGALGWFAIIFRLVAPTVSY